MVLTLIQIEGGLASKLGNREPAPLNMDDTTRLARIGDDFMGTVERSLIIGPVRACNCCRLDVQGQAV